MIHLKAATVLEKNDISWPRSHKDKPTEGYGWSGPHVVNKQEGRGGSGMNDSYLEGPGESHKSYTHSQLSACEVGFLFLVLLLPSSILVFMWPFPREGHAPCIEVSAGCSSARHIFPWKQMHWNSGGELSLLWAFGETDELSFWTKLRTRTYPMMFLPSCSYTLGPSL